MPQDSDMNAHGSHGSHGDPIDERDRLMADLWETASRRSGGSNTSSASQRRRHEAEVLLAKRQAEAVWEMELEALERDEAERRAKLQQRRDELLRRKEMDGRAAEIRALGEIERQEVEERPRPVPQPLPYSFDPPLHSFNPSVGEFQPRNPLPADPNLSPMPPVGPPASDSDKFVAIMTQQMQMMNRQIAFSTQIGPFTGDPMTFNYFMKQVEDVIERNLPEPRTRLNRLLEVVKGDPRALIEGCVFAPDETCYLRAKSHLQERYGNVLRVANAYMENLRKWPPIKDNCVKGLSDFHRALVRCLSVVDRAELDSPRFIGDLVPKLPFRLRNSWRTVVFQVRRFGQKREGFPQFVEFIQGVLERAEDPIYGEEAMRPSTEREKSFTENHRTPSKHFNAKRITSLAVSTTIPQTSSMTKSSSCLQCEASHDLEECPEYAAMDMKDKQTLIKDKGACFGCLNRGHMSRKCHKRRVCKTCGKEHPTSLHKTSSEDKESEALKVVTTRAVGMEGPVIAMSVVRVMAYCETNPTKVIEGLALLDPLSAGTFATTSLQTALEMQGPRTKIGIHTLNGQETNDTTILTGLRVKEPNGHGEVSLRCVYTKEEIPLQSNEVATPELSKQWQAFEPILGDIGQVNLDLPVILLIGADTPEALRPLNVIVGNEDDPSSPYAIRTRLGWSIMGPMGATKIWNQEQVTCHRILALPSKIVGREVIKDLGVGEMLSSLTESDFVAPTLSLTSTNGGVTEAISGDDLKFLEIVENGTKFEENSYEVPLPIRNRPLFLPESRDTVKKLVHGIVKRMEKNPDLKRDYFSFMGKMIKSEK